MKKLRIFTSYLSFLALIIAAASAIGVTYAAYLNATKYENPMDINTNALSSYFTTGGAGTEADPYKLSTPNDFRTLQKLTKLGVFHSGTFFSMTQDIAWTGDPLIPIGTEDTPFMSQFNGMGYTLSNLVVTGANIKDVGLFGYVSISGRLRNLVLSAPVINLTANTVGTRNGTTNPLETILASFATNTLGTLTRVTSTSSSVTYSVPAVTVTATELNGGQPITILYELSNTNLLYRSTTDTNQWITKATAGASSGDIFPVHLQARVYAMYQDKVISYTLERWHINVKGDGTVGTTDADVFKTVHQPTRDHEVYVGVFAGHLDGAASYLGIWGGNISSTTSNGKIIVDGRNVRSYNLLIGRSRDDSVAGGAAANVYNKFVDINTALIGKSTANYYVTEPNMTGNAAQTVSRMNTFNNSVATFNQNNYALSSFETQFIRIYPSPYNAALSQPYSRNVINYSFKIQDAEGNVIPAPPYYYGNVLQYTDAPVLGRLFEQNKSTYAFNVFSGFWLWATSDIDSTGKVGNILNETQFQIQFKITYVAETTSLLNQFKIMMTTYSVNNPNSVFNSTGYFEDTETNGFYNPALFPLISNTSLSGVIQEKTMSLMIVKASNKYPATPMFVLGVGKGSLLNSSVAPDYKPRSTYASDPFKLSVLSFDVMISSADGNASSILSFVDYLASNPTVLSRVGSAVTFSGWSVPSNVKMQFNAMNYNSILFPTTYRFFRTAGIGATGVSSRIYGIYSTYTPNPTVPPYPLFNTDGYSTATISSGAA